MWEFLFGVIVLFVLIIHSLYESGKSGTLKRIEVEKENIEVEWQAIKAERLQIDADKAWILQQKAKLLPQPEESKIYLTQTQLVISAITFIALAIVIMIIIKLIKSNSC